VQQKFDLRFFPVQRRVRFIEPARTDEPVSRES
jgi:hypothetical protein